MNNAGLRGVPAHEATGLGGCAPGISTPQASSTAPAAAPAAPPAAAEPLPVAAMEPLEDRRLLSAVALQDGVLTLTGDAAAANKLVVQPSGSSALYVYANNVNRILAKSAVRLVRFIGGAKADKVFLASTLDIPAEVKTGAGDDNIRLGRGNDYVDAGDGNDRIWSRPGNDKVIGGNGDDEFKGDDGNDYFDGGAGNDTADGGNGNDTLVGGAGNDTLRGGGGADLFNGGGGSNRLIDVNAADKVQGAPASAKPAPAPAPSVEPLEDRRLFSSVSLSGGLLQVVGDAGSANKLVVQRSGSSNLYVYANNVNKKVPLASVKSVKFLGGSKNDDIFLASDLNIKAEVKAGAGNDTIRLGGGDDYVDAGDGNDRIWSRPGNDKVIGGNGDDEFKGDDGNDYFDGGAGNDTADGGNGNDTLVGGAGNDSIIGNNGNDKLDGGDGNDNLRADAGNDTLAGGAGDDTLKGGSGADYFDGGAGKNLFLDLKAEDKVPHGSAHATPGGGNGSDAGGSVGAGITDNEAVIVGRSVNSDTPKPVINLIGRTGTGPHTVHVHALASTLNAGTYLTARWQWDFGDPGSRYNTLEGWNAAHVYNKPGTYTVKLTVTNEDGNSSTLTTRVTVVEDKRRTIYVDASRGNDSNNGATEATAVRSVKRVKALVGPHVRILFKRGQRHTFDQSLTLPYQDVLVGAYGSGDRPVLVRVKKDGTGFSTISMYNQSNQITVQDLVFDSPYAVKGSTAANIGVDGIYPRGVNITVRGCEFRDLDDAINANGNPRGLLVQDNTAPLATGLRNYFVWSEGSDHVFLGNTAANSTREHNIRSSGTQRMLIAYNNLTNLDRSKVDTLDYSKGTVEVHRGKFAYVWRNELHDGALRAGPRGGEARDRTTEWVVFDANELYEHNLTIKIGTHHFMARNNIVRTDTSSVISIETSDSSGRTVSDLHFVNNTGITKLSRGRFLNVPRAGGTRGAITLKNNLWIVPRYVAAGSASAPVYVEASNLEIFKEISNNVWPKPASYNKYGQGGIHYVWPKWSDARGFKDVAEWDAYSQVKDEKYENPSYNSSLMPARGTVASTAGHAAPGVFTDFFGRTRPTRGRVTAGAVQTT